MWQNLLIFIVFGVIEIFIVILFVYPPAKKWHGKILQIGKWLSVGLILVFIPLVLTYFTKIVSEQDNIFRFFTEGLWAEAFGIIFTIVVLNRLANNRAIEAEKRDLILQMGSPDNSFAIEAVRILKHRGWLYDGSLQGVYLGNSNLQGADFFLNSNLEGANFEHVHLEGASLWEANLKGVDFGEGNLQGVNLLNSNLECASLWYAHLEGAHLRGTNFEGANLEEAHLEGANLIEANLQGANLKNAYFDKKTVLPDGNHEIVGENVIVYGSWTPETDMSRYTDPNHPDFWQPDWVEDKE